MRHAPILREVHPIAMDLKKAVVSHEYPQAFDEIDEIDKIDLTGAVTSILSISSILSKA